MCRFLRVSRSAYYDWLHRMPTTGEKDDADLTDILQSEFKKSRATYGTRRLKTVFLRQDRTVSRRRIGRLMRETGLACKTKRKFKATTNSKHDQPIASNHLDRQFSVGQPDQVYAGDITYIHTQEGWLYLAVVIDLYSRQVVGWSMAEHMRTKLVNDALLMAVWKRKPNKGLVWHTDRGSQYASESFFHTLKTELIHHQTYQTRSDAKQAVFEYIEVFYNRERLHSANGYLSPVDYELQHKAA